MNATASRLLAALIIVGVMHSFAQVVISGRILGPRCPGAAETIPFSGVLCVASLEGSGTEARAFRTWETEPAGWYQIKGGAGNYTLAFTGPAHFIRPLVWNNVYTRPGEIIDRLPGTPPSDFFCFHEGEWDPQRATDYYQTFVAQGKSVTQVGFRLAHDGLDGFGPQSQHLLVSIHRCGDDTPDQWPQVGPTAVVLNVDSGGGKNYIWSAGWNSGEVPIQPGETYAVHLRAETPGNTFQAFWRADNDTSADCYRLGAGSAGFQKHDLWLSVGTDGDGLRIPYNKRVHKQFGQFAGFANQWSQTYVAQGRSLAAVVLYAAVGGTQPPLSRQRVAVCVRRGGPGGPTVGLEKIAIGNGNYTGDASWGVFCAAFASGEVPLVPGETYAVEFTSIENYETLHGFVNIKGEVSDDRPGFNPYRKVAPDTYPHGTAFKLDRDAADFDLDLQIIEYEHDMKDWRTATDKKNLLRNGDMESGELAEVGGGPEAWKRYSIDPATTHAYVADGKEKTNRLARVIGGGFNKQTVDGGFVQRIEGLSRLETYRLTGKVRASWAVDDQHQCWVGCDPTGQDNDPKATTIVWALLPGVHGVFVPHASDPIRPATNALSIWLRGRTTLTVDTPFKADFDDFALQRVLTGVPRGD